jgi:hypothetical protein
MKLMKSAYIRNSMGKEVISSAQLGRELTVHILKKQR